MAKVNGKVFDLKLFGRLMDYSNPYRWNLLFCSVFGHFTCLVFSTLESRICLKVVVDDYITPKRFRWLGTRFRSLLMLLLTLFLEVFFQFVFIYYANWLGGR